MIRSVTTPETFDLGGTTTIRRLGFGTMQLPGPGVWGRALPGAGPETGARSVATGTLAGEGGPLARLAHQYHATPSQLALAWLLKRSPVMLPIPGTSSIAHLDENLDATAIQLTDDQYAELDAEASKENRR